MVAKISVGNSLYGAIAYNGEKINEAKGRLLTTNRIYNDGTGTVDIHRAMEDFLGMMPVRSKVEKPVVHISLNPHPDDILTDTELQDIALEYLEKMGFGNQPYLVFKHEDIDRHHLHIVTVRVDEDGRSIDTRNNFYRSKQITRELERKYGLHDAERRNRRLDTPLHKVDASAGDVKKQVGNTVKALNTQYRFQSMGEYRALLSLYNVTVEEARGNVRGREYHGLVYSVTDDKGDKVGNPFKSSLFRKYVGYEAVQNKFARSKQEIKDRKLADMTKRTVLSVLEGTYDKEKFVATLREKGIDTVLRYTEEGRIYGATFIDHRTGCVLNGSRMGKELSANALQEHFTLPYAGQPPIPLSVPVEEPENRQGYSGGEYESHSSGMNLFAPEGPAVDAEEEAFIIRVSTIKNQCMSQQEDDLRALAKIMDFLRAVSIILVVMNVYWFCYEAIRLWGVDIGVVDRILMNFNRTAGLFRSILYTKLFAVLLLALSCLGTKGVKGEKITWGRIWTVLAAGFVLFFLNWWILALPLPVEAVTGLYVLTVGTGYVCLLMGGLWMSRLLKHNLMDDVFNNENESFMQETRLIESEYSVNLPTRFYYKKRWNNGWINVVNPFRASIVLGTPGSGKSYAVVNSFIKQQIEKGFSMYVYDFKFSDLSTIAYNHLLNHPDGYKVKPKFYVINFDDPRRSHRCNPIHPDFMEDITDAYESAYTIMLNLNKSWVQKQGDFFVESPIILFAAIIWYLKIFQNGKYCTFPHAIEFLNRRYEDIFPILTSYPELENYLSPFMDAWLGGAAEQLMGQIASAKIPLSRMISPQLYWVMSDSEFTLDINNPEEPKILCVGNNPDRQNIYGAALGLYNSRIVKLINKKGMLKSSVIIDELPTIYFKGLDNLIATARSNKVAVCLGFQDFSQLVRDYGDKEAKVVMNTVGNIFSGQVVGETAKTLSERFGKVLQKRQSISINRQDVSTSINTQMDALIPPSKISGLTQGMFVGSVSDNFNERIEQKIFHCEIVVDAEKVKREEKAYKPIPVITDFTDEDGNDCMKETVQANYRRIKEEVKQIVQEELERIANDENLKHLLQQK